MQDKSFIILNPEAYRFKKVKKHFDENNIKYYVSYEKDHLIEIVSKKINEGIERFVLCGGDGTINRFINSVMKLPDKNKTIFIGIIPCGRANDLARYMNIPLDIEEAFERLEKNRIKKIDLIKINNDYMITGGGLGLPSEIIEDVDNFSSGFVGNFLKSILGDQLYFIFTIKKFIFGYKGIEIKSKKDNRLLAIYIMNQSFLGKKFDISPEAENDDGYFDVKIVKIPPSFLSNFITLSKGVKGELSDLSWIKGKKTKKMSFSLNKYSYFMGDGELFEKNKDFVIKIVPRAINIYC